MKEGKQQLASQQTKLKNNPMANRRGPLRDGVDVGYETMVM